MNQQADSVGWHARCFFGEAPVYCAFSLLCRALQRRRPRHLSGADDAAAMAGRLLLLLLLLLLVVPLLQQPTRTCLLKA